MLDRTQAPAVKPFEFRPLPPEIVEILPNGIHFHRYSGGDQPVCNLLLSFSGGVEESPSEYEIQMCMALMQEGTARRTGAQIAEDLDFCGARMQRSVSSHYAGINTMMLNSGLDNVLPILGDMVANATFPADAVAAARNRAISQLQVNLSKVSYLADRTFARMVWGENHPNARTATEEQIRAITSENLLNLKNSTVATRTGHAFLSGLLDESTIDKVRRFLESIEAPGPGITPMIIPAAPESPRIEYTDKPGSLQSAIAAGLPAIGRNHPDYIPLRIAVTALGGYFGSRLMSNIREDKGYTYGISSYLSGTPEGSFVQISAQCDNSYTHAVIDEIRNELRDLAENPPQGEELRRLKLFCSTNLVEILDSPISILGYHATSLFAGIPSGYFEAQQRAIGALSPDTIAAMAELYLRPDSLRIAVAADKSKL